MKYTTDKLDEIAKKLKGMPQAETKKPELNKFDAIKYLQKEIASLQKKGYTVEQITESLKGEGIDISTATLRTYLTKLKANKKSQPKTAGDTPAAQHKATFVASKDRDEI